MTVFNHILIAMWALLFVSQTMAAAFDVHSIHQETNATQMLSHRNLDTSHKSHAEGTLKTLSDQASFTANNEQSQFDCHHCCHCHAPSVVFILCTEESSPLYQNNKNIILGKVALFSFLLAPEHRPPIS